MTIKLYQHQLEVLDKIRPGSILKGGVGSGKSITSLAYYHKIECNGQLEPFKKMKNPKDLYIITTARKRDDLEWEAELGRFLLSTNQNISYVKVVVDSWNNIKKYKDIENAFFIFDEQRLVGGGAWVKWFLKIAKKNKWILLSATPGDVWSDYIPVFIANGFYKNRTEFAQKHIVYSRFTKYPKIEKYVNCDQLIKFRDKIIITMDYEKKVNYHHNIINVKYSKKLFDTVLKKRWNPYKDKPIKNISELYYTMRKVVNSDSSRLEAIKDLCTKHDKIIIFYNFNYERDILIEFCKIIKISYAEYNGHNHEQIPNDDKWLYIVQYTSGAEGWNCITTNAVLLYSQNYSYRITTQALGRIDRLNTKFKDLYSYRLFSDSYIDNGILKAYKEKRNFNETNHSREKHSI